jgi:hypothetical protein
MSYRQQQPAECWSRYCQGNPHFGRFRQFSIRTRSGCFGRFGHFGHFSIRTGSGYFRWFSARRFGYFCALLSDRQTTWDICLLLLPSIPLILSEGHGFGWTRWVFGLGQAGTGCRLAVFQTRTRRYPWEYRHTVQTRCKNMNKEGFLVENCAWDTTWSQNSPQTLTFLSQSAWLANDLWATRNQ